MILFTQMNDDPKELAKAILGKGHLMSLATVDDGGPWVCDVIYVFDEDWNLYWLSEITTRHSETIIKNPAVAATITISNKSKESNEGLQISGIARKIEGDILAMAIKHRLKRNYQAPVKEGEILGSGESWYCLKPNKIELIYEPRFGFKKEPIL